MSINKEFYETYGVWNEITQLYYKTEITLVGYRSPNFHMDVSKISVRGPERIVSKLPEAYWFTSPILLKCEWKYAINHRITNSLLIANELRDIITCYIL